MNLGISEKEKLSKHNKWLVGDEEGQRANLSDADLSGADLSWANLSDANLSGADLSNADLNGSDLRWANLSGANLSWANLSDANLSGANLSWANLFGANLFGADLRWANLREANLREANLRGANLRGADLSGAKGIVYIGFDWRGYTLICWLNEGEKWFNSSCRSFSMAAALAHWGASDYENQSRGQLYITAIKFLAEMADEVLK